MRQLNIYMGCISSDHRLVLPYTCGILRSYAEQDTIIKKNTVWQPFIFHSLEGVDKMFENVKDPDILALSCYSWNMNHNKKLIRLVKEHYPNCLIIQGGSSVPENIQNFDDFPGTDIAVIGEGEIPFKNIVLQAVYGNNDWELISGIAYMKEGIFYKNPKDITANTVDYPSPYLQGYFIENEKEIIARSLPTVALLETNRGCPYKCTFCTVGDISFTKVRKIDWDRLVGEIEYCGSRMDELLITDSNFGLLPRDLELSKMIAEQINIHGKIKTWHTSYAKSTNDVVNDRVMDIARIIEKRNLSREGVTISLQSTTESVLAAINRINTPPEKFRNLQERFNDEHLAHFTELIVGLPNETLSSFLDTVELVLDGYPLEIGIYALVLFPNTAMASDYMRETYKLKTRVICLREGVDEEEYEYVEQVIGTKDISEKKMHWLLKWRESLQFLYLGKWLFFISEYLKKEKNIRIVDFFKDLIEYAFENKQTVLSKCIKSWYIKNWNSGSFVAFKGPISPHNIEWGVSASFQKNTFHWLCISSERDQFYDEIEQYLKSQYEWDDVLEELFKYQKEAMLTYDFDVEKQTKLQYSYNWFEFFNNKAPLCKRKNSITYNTIHVGRYRNTFIPNDSFSYFEAAGGYHSHFQKMNSFFHRAAKIEYTDGEIAEYEPSDSSGNPKIIEKQS